MGEPLVPEPVARVLADLDSVFELELLLLLRELPGQDWTPAALGRLLDADPDASRTALIQLSRRGLIERRFGGESLCFRFDPDQTRSRNLDELAVLYLQQRAVVVSFIEARSATALRQFSDAFRFRKEEREC